MSLIKMDRRDVLREIHRRKVARWIRKLLVTSALTGVLYAIYLLVNR